MCLFYAIASNRKTAYLCHKNHSAHTSHTAKRGTRQQEKAATTTQAVPRYRAVRHNGHSHTLQKGMKTERVIIAGNQELTAIAARTLVEQTLAAAENASNSGVTICRAGRNAELISEFQKGETTAVVVDYPLFDFSTRENFTMLCECYENVTWLILSEELTDDFLRHVLYSTNNVGWCIRTRAAARLLTMCSPPLPPSDGRGLGDEQQKIWLPCDTHRGAAILYL